MRTVMEKLVEIRLVYPDQFYFGIQNWSAMAGSCHEFSEIIPITMHMPTKALQKEVVDQS